MTGDEDGKRVARQGGPHCPAGVRMSDVNSYPTIGAYFTTGDAGFGQQDPALKGRAEFEMEQRKIEAYRTAREEISYFLGKPGYDLTGLGSGPKQRPGIEIGSGQEDTTHPRI